MEDMVRDNIGSLVYPLFIKKGIGVKEEIASMPGQYRFSADTLIDEAGFVYERGIDKLLLFEIADIKDEYGSSAYRQNSVIPYAVAELKKNFPDIIVMTDICLCAYTSHGHCGILKDCAQVSIDNEKTLDALSKMALLHAAAGADYVAPSAMAKQQVSAIRHALDNNGYRNTKIMGYSAKFSSQFYGPFRGAAKSAPRFGDRRGYQLSPDDSFTALKEVEEDIREGADIIMVKPALGYLDIIRQVRDRFPHTLAAYNVSGEYAMVKAGSALGYWDERKMVYEIIASIKRSGADLIITYHARDIVKWLFEKEAQYEKEILFTK
ncbi:MAG: porphobilinogen synthase [Candidatus Omnitrophota bacterium]